MMVTPTSQTCHQPLTSTHCHQYRCQQHRCRQHNLIDVITSNIFSDCFYQFEPMRAFGTKNYAGNNFDDVYSSGDSATSFFKEKIGTGI